MGSITAVKSLLEKGHLSQDCVLLVDEMYLQKGTQFHVGEYIGATENDEFYKGIMVFMITGRKNPVPSVIKACSEVKVNGIIYSRGVWNALFFIGC